MLTEEDVISVIRGELDRIMMRPYKLAEHVGMDPQRMRAILNGKRHLRGYELLRICQLLRLELMDFTIAANERVARENKEAEEEG